LACGTVPHGIAQTAVLARRNYQHQLAGMASSARLPDFAVYVLVFWLLLAPGCISALEDVPQPTEVPAEGNKDDAVQPPILPPLDTR
jgi:hypothetical protein